MHIPIGYGPDLLTALYSSCLASFHNMKHRAYYSKCVLEIIFSLLFVDSLVLHLQLLHDGHFPGWSGVHDPDEDTKERLRQIQQGGGNG